AMGDFVEQSDQVVLAQGRVLVLLGVLHLDHDPHPEKHTDECDEQLGTQGTAFARTPRCRRSLRCGRNLLVFRVLCPALLLLPGRLCVIGLAGELLAGGSIGRLMPGLLSSGIAVSGLGRRMTMAGSLLGPCVPGVPSSHRPAPLTP